MSSAACVSLFRNEDYKSWGCYFPANLTFPETYDRIAIFAISLSFYLCTLQQGLIQFKCEIRSAVTQHASRLWHDYFTQADKQLFTSRAAFPVFLMILLDDEDRSESNQNGHNGTSRFITQNTGCMHSTNATISRFILLQWVIMQNDKTRQRQAVCCSKAHTFIYGNCKVNLQHYAYGGKMIKLSLSFIKHNSMKA